VVAANQQSKVIVISGSASGAGKSTLDNRLSELMPDSCAMYFSRSGMDKLVIELEVISC